MKLDLTFFKFFKVSTSAYNPFIIGALTGVSILSTLLIITVVPWALYIYSAPYILNHITTLPQFIHPSYGHFAMFEFFIISFMWIFHQDK